MDLLIFLLVGAAAGWLAGQIMKGKGFGLWGNLLVGIVGAFIGGFLFAGYLPAMDAILSQLISALLGAIILLAIISLVKKA